MYFWCLCEKDLETQSPLTARVTLMALALQRWARKLEFRSEFHEIKTAGVHTPGRKI